MRRRPSAIVALVGGLLVLAWLASRFVRPGAHATCAKLVRLRTSAILAHPPQTTWNAWSPGFLDVEACTRTLEKARSEHTGPRARLVQANEARCVLHADALRQAEDCSQRAAFESLPSALMHFP